MALFSDGDNYVKGLRPVPNKDPNYYDLIKDLKVNQFKYASLCPFYGSLSENNEYITPNSNQ